MRRCRFYNKMTPVPRRSGDPQDAGSVASHMDVKEATFPLNPSGIASIPDAVASYTLYGRLHACRCVLAVSHTAGLGHFLLRKKKVHKESPLLSRRRGYRLIRQRGFL
jgi:hypothetical protein